MSKSKPKKGRVVRLTLRDAFRKNGADLLMGRQLKDPFQQEVWVDGLGRIGIYHPFSSLHPSIEYVENPFYLRRNKKGKDIKTTHKDLRNMAAPRDYLLANGFIYCGEL